MSRAGKGVYLIRDLRVTASIRLCRSAICFRQRRALNFVDKTLDHERIDAAQSVGFCYEERLEVERRGRAYSPDENGIFKPLEESTELNLRVSQWIDTSVGKVEFYLRADNVTNALVEPQLGLAAPGRWIKGGFAASF